MPKLSPENPSKVVIVHHPPQPESTQKGGNATKCAAPAAPKKPCTRPTQPQPKNDKIEKPEPDAKAVLKDKTVR